MRPLLQLHLITLVLILSACNHKPETPAEQSEKQESNIVKKHRPDGTLSSLNQVDEEGYIHGVKVNYYEDGKTIHSRVTYEHGRRHGPAIWYYGSGKVYEHTQFYSNRRHGLTRRYYESGQLLEEIHYDTGEQTSYKKFDRAGKLLKEE